ncbi:hypothetical protein NDU88_006508 [Pleurodeles waltl]|uniref:Uncharacterized protein n=1 Tax=Pleurodeles waltl TaxID=8319 RepID=A0AAV7WB04_PLEWA|nr:hypothetical protein NDU88_006508 [Pleurodeles waltl]
MEAVAVEVNLLRTDLRKVSHKVKVVEGSNVDLQTEVSTLRKQMAQVTSMVGMLEARLEDSEGRSRRNNRRLLGFPTRAEGSSAEGSVERWITDVLKPEALSRAFVVERAHRALVTPPRPGVPPRVIIARLLNYKNRDRGKAHFVEHPEEVWRWLEIWDKAGTGRSVKSTKRAARASGVDDMDWRKRQKSQTQISAQRADISNGRVEIQQDGTMAVVVSDMAVESTEPSGARMALISVDT